MTAIPLPPVPGESEDTDWLKPLVTGASGLAQLVST